MKELINAITLKHNESGIDVYDPATEDDITDFEKQMGFPLPVDFKELYTICNGFSCKEDIFNIVPLSEITQRQKDFGKNWFYFAEYMIYSDMWVVKLTEQGQYEIFNENHPDLVLTSSLHEFLGAFLQGNIFDPGGLYTWQSEIHNKKS